MRNVNTNAVQTASRCNTEYFWNDEDSIRVRVEVSPGNMELKLESHGGSVSYSTRHGHTLAEVRARAVKLVTLRDLPMARRHFRACA